MVDFYKTNYNSQVERIDIGVVKLDREGVKDSLGHGIGSKKAAAYAAVPEVIKNGFIFDKQTNWKGRGYDTVVLIAPIKITGEDYVCEVVIEKRPNRQGFYLHEVDVIKNLGKMFKTPTEGSILPSKLIIAQKIADVNSDGKFYQRAFSASRVDYEHLSLEYIGSGEGAQSHGLGCVLRIE